MGPPWGAFCQITLTSCCIAQSPQTPTVRPGAHYIVIISCVIQRSMHGWKETFLVLGERQMSIVFFSVQSAAGSTLSVRRWKMLDPLFSGLSVGRRSLWDWRSAVRTEMKWQRLTGASPWCSLVIVQVMPCGRENTAYTRFVHWLAANIGRLYIILY